jgi:hypothetical protein
VELGNPKLEVLCFIHKPHETRDGKHGLVEEKDFELLPVVVI